MKENLNAINQQMPHYSKLAKIRLQIEAFVKTPKLSIKRYLYQKEDSEI